jgi:hypothetical protein
MEVPEARMVPNLESDFPFDLLSQEGNLLFLGGVVFQGKER